MTTPATLSLPSRGTVLWVQLRVIAGSCRGVFLVIGALAVAWVLGWLTLLGPEIVAERGRAPEGLADLRRISGPLTAIPWLGVLFGLTAWDKETPEKRTYHRVQPVPEPMHDLARVAAGAIWMIPAVLLVAFADLAVLLYLGYGSGLAELPPSSWLAPLGGALVAYLVTTVPALVSSRPGTWVIGVLIAGAISATTFRQLELEGPFAQLVSIWSGSLGLGVVVGREALFQPVDRWVPALALWLAIGLAAVILSARRYKEPS